MKRNNFIQIYSKIYQIYDLFIFSLNYILIKSLIEDTDNIMHITVDKLIDIFLTLKRKKYISILTNSMLLHRQFQISERYLHNEI